MENREEIIKKIKALANEKATEKVKKIQEETNEKIKQEAEKIEKCLKYIENKLVFKIVRENGYIKNYVLANEEMFMQDYIKKPKFDFYRGIEFCDESQIPLFMVNGEEYFDMRYIIENYKRAFNEYSSKLKSLQETFKRIEEKGNDLLDMEKGVKSLLEKCQKVKIEEE